MCNIFVSTYWYIYDIFNSAEWYMSCICHSVVFHVKFPRQTSPRDLFKSPGDNSLCGLAYMCHIHFVRMVFIYNMCNIFVSTYWYMYDIFNSAEWYMSCICHSVVFHMKFPRVVYVMHMPRADLRFAALSRLPVTMKQSFSLRCDLLVNLLRITRGERFLCIIQLVTRTPAGGTLHCRTHSSM